MAPSPSRSAIPQPARNKDRLNQKLRVISWCIPLAAAVCSDRTNGSGVLATAANSVGSADVSREEISAQFAAYG
jgi:hypothetical protein